ncbi:hypothetical protein [Streptomyces aidingensis]|uniref:DUF4034 domain-containing protein n=1 Tax=Streptomyces aidingensis TaxID=910347 RepID=A0A1I1ELH8_9ACTN|nr:hypothetical protein [Streptomyces aidingensis]SFB87887.1 hypothetical protein SAMN05421773_101359 [Streptomyces aidingensis]
MEFLLVLFACTVLAVIVARPAILRHLRRRDFERAAASSPRPPLGPEASGDRPVSFRKEGADGDAGPGRVTEGGLVPVENLDRRLPGPDDELIEALEETQRTQDWRPAGQLLALTDDVELRWQRVQSLAGAAAMELARWQAAQGSAGPDEQPPGAPEATGVPGGAPGAPVSDAGWLREWRREQPADAGGAQVYAQFLVWQALSDPGSAGHRIILEEARTVCREAAGLAADDPTPLITELMVARVLGDGRPEFEALWQRVVRLAPDHMGAHLAALPYWSEKWHGSRKEAYAFAESAAAGAAPGSLLPALPLFAVYDHLPEVTFAEGVYRGKVTTDAIEAAHYALLHARPGHPVLPHVHHLLLFFLVRAERYPEAAEQVRAVDGYVGALPWVNSEDPARQYAAYRALAIGGQ